jgi:DNA-binding FadR family transcriptional regulator
LLDRRDDYQQQGRHDDFVRADTDFHLAVVRCSHNPVLTELYCGLTEVLMASVATTSAKPVEADQIRHRGLVEAIAAADVEGAGREAGGFLDELLDQLPPD